MVTPCLEKSGLILLQFKITDRFQIFLLCQNSLRSSPWLSSLATWWPITCSQIINPAFVDITPPSQRSSESSLTSTLPSIGPSLPSCPPWRYCSVRNCGPQHLTRTSFHVIWPVSPSWSPTSLDVCRSSMLVDASLPRHGYFGIPQSSVLGPVLYVLYTADIIKLVESVGLRAHLYADDTTLYGYCCPSTSAELSTRVLQAIDLIHAWMSSNRLSLNTGKAQFIWFVTRAGLAKRDMHQLSSQSPSLAELTTVQNLGFTLDQELTMEDHVSKLCQSCYFQLHQIRTIQHSLSPSAIRTVVHAFICSRIGFSNSLLYGRARIFLIVFSRSWIPQRAWFWKSGNTTQSQPLSDGISMGYRSQARIQFMLNVVTRNCLVGQVPAYLNELCHSIIEIPARSNLRSATQVQLLVPRFRKERSGRRRFSISSPQLWNTYFQVTFDSYTRSHNFLERDSKLIICSSLFFATDYLRHQCDIYYYY